MTTPDLDLDALHLAKGSHPDRSNGLCLQEAVAFAAGEPHSDHPKCASPVLATFGRSLNDVLPDDLRQQLKPLIVPQIGTRGDGHDETRSLMALDWLTRTWLPAWLDLAKLDDDARAVRELAQIVDLETAQAAGPIVRTAQQKSAAARAAAGAAAWAAAGDDAGAAAGAAARAAAWAAARDAAWAAAWDAARAAAGAAAWAAARDAAVVTAWDAARAAARDAAVVTAWDAAGAAAGAALAPTVVELQRSAIDLYTRMVHVS